jgi:protocatechuate 4,5-dioxygenase alpha subunit
MEIPGTYVFDIASARRGFGFNKMAYSLQQPANREIYVQDERAYMDKYGLSERQIDAVLTRDWLTLIREGANSYMLMKLGATIGIGHYHQGAQERGETYEEFLATRNVPGAT